MVNHDEHQTLNRRSAIAGLTLAGIGAILAACRVDSGGRSPATSVSLDPLTPADQAELDPTPETSPAEIVPDEPVVAPAEQPEPSSSPAIDRTRTVPLQQRALYGHLLRRAGFGASPGELEEWMTLSWSDAVDRLIDYQSISNQALEDRLAALNLDLTRAPDIQRWWLIRMVETARPLEEKMTLFWHGFLTSDLNAARAPVMLKQNEFFRSHALEDYGTILKGITRDEAMMRYLNTIENKKDWPNENYARELMELFTMGPGNYTETDVREAARAFTGLTVRRDGTTVLSPSDHDDGVKTFLGETGNWGPDDIVDIILRQEATAPFVAWRLLYAFHSQFPAQETIGKIADVLRRTRFSMREAMRALFNLPEFKDAAVYRTQIKSPAEYLATAVRQLGATTDGRFYAAALSPMGQVLFNPPNVAGWPGGPDWLNSGTWLARLNLANTLTTNRTAVELSTERWFGGATPATVEQWVDGLAELLVDGNLADDQRRVLYDFARDDRLQPGSRAWFDSRGRATLYLLLALPEFHLN